MERLEAGVVTREFQTVISVFSLRRIEDEKRGERGEGGREARAPVGLRASKELRMYPTRNWFALVPSRWRSLFHANRSLVETPEILVWDCVHCLENRATIYYYSSSNCHLPR